MCHGVCFEAGRFTQIQSSWTARCCSRKWMSGPADALTQFQRDRKRSIAALTVGIIHALQILLGGAGNSVFSLDKSLSWMSHLILFGERSLRKALSQLQEHYHEERNHQGKGNVLLFPARAPLEPGRQRGICCRERLGGLLRYYGRAA